MFIPIWKIDGLPSKSMSTVAKELDTPVRHERMADERLSLYRFPGQYALSFVFGEALSAAHKHRGRECWHIAAAIESP